jgi:hypothetical protein
MAQIGTHKGQTLTIQGGAVWAGLPDGTLILSPIDGNITVVAANEYNLVPVSAAPPVPISATSPVTVQVAGPTTS